MTVAARARPLLAKHFLQSAMMDIDTKGSAAIVGPLLFLRSRKPHGMDDDPTTRLFSIKEGKRFVFYEKLAKALFSMTSQQ
jgi:hypothetical protein